MGAIFSFGLYQVAGCHQGLILYLSVGIPRSLPLNAIRGILVVGGSKRGPSPYPNVRQPRYEP